MGAVTFGPILEGSNTDPDGGQIFPAKYSFDVTANPDCTNDFVTLGLPATPVADGQANIVGYNNLYSAPNGSGFCTGTGPNVLFAYASGTGEVPGSIALSPDGKKLAYIEDLLSGSSYFHVLQWETGDGTDSTHAIVPGAGNPNATDVTVLLSPDGGTTNQSSTTSPFIDYTNDAAYVTTYSWASGGSGYLYKISPVFGPGTPMIVWSVAVGCGAPSSVPSSPVYDSVSQHVLFTDTGARIDYVADTGGTPTVVCGPQYTFDNTAANPPEVDSTNQFVYASFNNDEANEFVVETSTTPTGSFTMNAGVGSTTYTSPYGVDFSNDYYNCNTSLAPCAGSPVMYAAGTDSSTGAVPTLYSQPIASDLDFSGAPGSTPLATGAADSSPVTEFYNVTASTDYLFVGVTDNCAATAEGGTGGCVMSLNITGGAPTITSTTTAISAEGGSTGIVIDNDSNDPQASSIYYATKTGGTLVKATQAGLN